MELLRFVVFIFSWLFILIFFVMETNYMHYLSSIDFVSQPLHDSGMFIAHHQEVFTVYVQQLVCVIHLSWLAAGRVRMAVLSSASSWLHFKEVLLWLTVIRISVFDMMYHNWIISTKKILQWLLPWYIYIYIVVAVLIASLSEVCTIFEFTDWR
jgi:hypothetical protein